MTMNKRAYSNAESNMIWVAKGYFVSALFNTTNRNKDTVLSDGNTNIVFKAVCFSSYEDANDVAWIQLHHKELEVALMFS